MSTPDTAPRPTVLILGGTGEAAALAGALVDLFGETVRVISSLAGRTAEARRPAGDVRIGGFGGADGLARFLRAQSVDLVIDATHPFAKQIAANARMACKRAGRPRLMLCRPPWPRRADDCWHVVADAQSAAAAVAQLGRRVFLTIGTRDLAAFAALHDHWFLVRLIAAPSEPLPIPEYQLITGRGPFSFDEELAVLDTHRIDVLVTKASGGDATAAKLAAARARSLPVVVIRRPPAECGERVEDVKAAVAWVQRRL